MQKASLSKAPRIPSVFNNASNLIKFGFSPLNVQYFLDGNNISVDFLNDFCHPRWLEFDDPIHGIYAHCRSRCEFEDRHPLVTCEHDADMWPSRVFVHQQRSLLALNDPANPFDESLM